MQCTHLDEQNRERKSKREKKVWAQIYLATKDSLPVCLTCGETGKQKKQNQKQNERGEGCSGVGMGVKKSNDDVQAEWYLDS
jgi:hypothetical protein